MWQLPWQLIIFYWTTRISTIASQTQAYLVKQVKISWGIINMCSYNFSFLSFFFSRAFFKKIFWIKTNVFDHESEEVCYCFIWPLPLPKSPLDAVVLLRCRGHLSYNGQCRPWFCTGIDDPTFSEVARVKSERLTISLTGECDKENGTDGALENTIL